MRKIKVNLKQRGYDVNVGSGALNLIPEILTEISASSPVILITDRNVTALSGKIISRVISKIRNPVTRIVLTPGERSKSLGVFSGAVKKIASGTRGHKPIILALGGGVIGDLAGFVASSYRRGVPLVQVPTTLLAQVDSSIGGKVGIDLPEAKNIIGSFYQPRAVVSDIRFLSSLPPRQLRNGMAEVIKYAVIKSREMFVLLESNMEKVRLLDLEFMEEIIGRCAEIKAEVVKKDELDNKDLRIVLNFGHTLGHAVETASGYSDIYNHGESVALGMAMAGEIAARLGIFKTRDQERLIGLLVSAGLPVSIRGVSSRKILVSYKYDKKFTTGVNRFVLPESFGKVRIAENVPESLIKQVVRSFTSGADQPSGRGPL